MDKKPFNLRSYDVPILHSFSINSLTFNNHQNLITSLIMASRISYVNHLCRCVMWRTENVLRNSGNLIPVLYGL